MNDEQARKEILVQEAVNDCFLVQRQFCEICEDFVAGVVLSRILYWSSPSKGGKSKLKIYKEGNYWLAKKRTDWKEECCLTPKQYDRAIRILKDDLKVVEVKAFKFDGTPIPHIRIKWSNLRAKQVEYEAKVAAEFEGEVGIDERSIPDENANRGESGLLPLGKVDFPQRSKSLTLTTNKDYIQQNKKKKNKKENSEGKVEKDLYDYFFHASLDFAMDLKLRKWWKDELANYSDIVTTAQANFTSSLFYVSCISDLHNKYKDYSVAGDVILETENYGKFLNKFDGEFKTIYAKYHEVYGILVTAIHHHSLTNDTEAHPKYRQLVQQLAEMQLNEELTYPYYPLQEVLEIYDELEIDDEKTAFADDVRQGLKKTHAIRMDKPCQLM
jgi:hypothetical protein